MDFLKRYEKHILAALAVIIPNQEAVIETLDNIGVSLDDVWFIVQNSNPKLMVLGFVISWYIFRKTDNGKELTEEQKTLIYDEMKRAIKRAKERPAGG